MFQTYDLKELLDITEAKHMSVSELCNIVDIPVTSTDSVNASLEEVDSDKLVNLMMYLLHLHTDEMNSNYLTEKIESLCQHYHLSYDTICGFLNLTKEEMNQFLNNPQWGIAEYKLAAKLINFALLTERYFFKARSPQAESLLRCENCQNTSRNKSE